MRVDQIERVAQIKEQLEQQQARLLALNYPKFSFKVDIRSGHGLNYTMHSKAYSAKDIESSQLNPNRAAAVKQMLIDEAQERIDFYTKQLASYGVEVKPTSHIRAA